MNIISKEKRAPLLLILVLFALLVIISGQIKEDLETTVLEKVVRNATAPALRVASGTARGADSLWDRYLSLSGAEKERLRLQREVEIFRLREMLWKEEKKKLRTIEEAFHLEKIGFENHILGEVVFLNVTESGHSAIINRGLRDGVRNGMNIVTPRGLAGRVKEAGERFSKVLLLTDSSSRIAVRVVRKDGKEIQAILTGHGDRCLLEFMMGSHEVNVDDEVLTSGKDRMYHTGLRAGYVEAVEKESGRKEISVRPAVDLHALNEVIVLKTLPELPDVSLK